ncbi:MAG TPA: porin family protein [Ferruginibacter sp.]|nr:porin family protein [Ferruginibacter sp.]
MRKNLILSVVILFVGVTVATAQENTPYVRDNLIRFGLKTGLNVSGAYNVTGDEFIAKARPGFVAGVFLNFPIGNRIGIQPEALFSQRGIRARGKMLGAPYDFTRTTTYIDVPVLLTIKATDVLSLVAGPQFSHLIKQKDVFANNTMSAQLDEFKKDKVRNNTIAVIAGAQFNINSILIDARVGWDVRNNTDAAVRTTPRYNYVWYQFTVGTPLTGRRKR